MTEATTSKTCGNAAVPSVSPATVRTRKQDVQVLPRAAQRLLHLGGGAVLHQVSQSDTERYEREVAGADLDARAEQGGGAVVPCQGKELPQQPGLSRAGLAGDQNRAGSSVLRASPAPRRAERPASPARRAVG